MSQNKPKEWLKTPSASATSSSFREEKSPEKGGAHSDCSEELRNVEIKDLAAGMQQINFTCHKQTVTGEIVFIVGSIPEFGNWTEFKAKMTWCNGHHWKYSLKIKKGSQIEYKYALLTKEGTQLEAWEKGDNRKIDLDEQTQSLVQIHDTFRAK